MTPEINPAYLTFLCSAVMALSGFIGFLVKKILDIHKESVTATVEVKNVVANNTVALQQQTTLIQEHLLNKGNN